MTNEIRVDNLVVDFALDNKLFNRQYMRAVNDVSFVIPEGQALAIVGESGSGKSTCARALCGVTPPTQGTITINGQPIEAKSSKQQRRQIAKLVQMIFQDPFGSLNSVHTIRHHLLRPVSIHQPHLTAEQVDEEIIKLLNRVRLTPAEQTANKHPHELSGGQRQRVAIARSLAVGAPYILADEPISMLDVSIRLGILNLMADMKEEGIGFLYITHDIATARYFAERTAVMYVGHMVEWGESDRVTQNPHHPYTQLLISSVPGAKRYQTKTASNQVSDKKEAVQKSNIPLWTLDSKGCPFVERCPKVQAVCKETLPAVTQLGDDHFVRCYEYQ